MEPKLAYFVLSSHRSGSSLLCELLSKTGVAGHPGEFFSHWNGMSHKSWDYSDYPAYIQRVIEDIITSNGVFAAKVMTGLIGGIEGAVAEFRKHPDCAQTPLKELLAKFFPNLKFIYLMRRNKVAQAVSWWKAAQNDQYFLKEGIEPADKDLNYNATAISALVTEIVMEDASHQEFLTSMAAIPYPVIYEDFIRQMPETITAILDFLEIAETSRPFTPPTLLKQADALSEAWVEQYRREEMEKAAHPRWTDWLRQNVNL